MICTNCFENDTLTATGVTLEEGQLHSWTYLCLNCLKEFTQNELEQNLHDLEIPFTPEDRP